MSETNGKIETTLEVAMEMIERLQNHMTTMVKAFESLSDAVGINGTNIGELSGRVHRLENKTQGLSDRPSTQNCPKCHRRVTTANGTCNYCGARVA